MKRSEIEKLHQLLNERDRKLDLLNNLSNASILKISDGKHEILGLGQKSPLRPYILNSVKEYLNSIDQKIKDIDPNFEFDNEITK